MPSTKVRVELRIDAELKEWLDAEAERQRRSLNNLIEGILLAARP